MKAFAFVLLAVAAVHCDSDAYTIGQVAHGAGYGGVVTGIDYGYGHVAGYGAIGNHGFYGKREADSDAYTIAQVAHGLPIHNAYATGHPHNVGVATGVGYGGYGGYGHYGYYGKREAEPYTIGQVAHGLYRGVVTGVSYGHGVGYGHGIGYGLGGYYGKREAEPYTIGQVAHGLYRGVVTGVSYPSGPGYGYAGHLYG